MLIDTHCHIPNSKDSRSARHIISNAKDSGVTRVIDIGTSLMENAKVINVAEEFPEVYATIAVYPHEDMDKNILDITSLLEKQLTLSKKIVAIGECGIDISDHPNTRLLNEQLELFESQINLAIKNKLPIVLHNRNGDSHVENLFSKYVQQGLIGVAHCFSSNLEFAKKLLDFGFYISFAGNLTYKSNESLREVAKFVPQDRLLTETDAPYLPPEGYRGQINEPKLVVEVVKKLSEIRGVEFDKIAQATYSNACRLFNLPNE